eukprot:75508-Chlamydomonas_euryale.AAC.1
MAAAARRLPELLPLASENPLDVVSVRGVDMSILKESVRELKDKLAKAATQTEYRLYERVRALQVTNASWSGRGFRDARA